MIVSFSSSMIGIKEQKLLFQLISTNVSSHLHFLIFLKLESKFSTIDSGETSCICFEAIFPLYD